MHDAKKGGDDFALRFDRKQGSEFSFRTVHRQAFVKRPIGRLVENVFAAESRVPWRLLLFEHGINTRDLFRRRGAIEARRAPFLPQPVAALDFLAEIFYRASEQSLRPSPERRAHCRRAVPT